MNSQIYNKQELYPEDFDEDDKLQFDMYLEQSKQLFPKMANDEWLLKMGIIAYMKKEKQGGGATVSPEEIAEIKNRYTQDTVFYTEPVEQEAKEITVQE
jgi:hypothetical protein